MLPHPTGEAVVGSTADAAKNGELSACSENFGRRERLDAGARGDYA
jgi:hypothetical protein